MKLWVMVGRGTHDTPDYGGEFWQSVVHWGSNGKPSVFPLRTPEIGHEKAKDMSPEDEPTGLKVSNMLLG